MDLSYGQLIAQLTYDPKTGTFTRNKNGKKTGYEAPDGRVYIRLTMGKPKLYMVHRIAWLFMTTSWPVGVIDHIDGNPSNNTWVNLRDVSMSENQHNRGLQKNNTSGKKGVSWNPKNENWRVRIMRNYAQINVGSYTSHQEACVAYDEAELKYHGRRPTNARTIQHGS